MTSPRAPLPPTTPAAAPTVPQDEVLTLDGASIAVRVYGKLREAPARPAVLYFHGGRFTDGSLDTGDATARWLAADGAPVVSVAYPLAPQHPFPAAVEAGHAVLDWLRRQPGRRGRPVVVCGEEAGGNIAAGVATMARDRDPDAVAGQLLIVPVLDPCMGSASSRGASIGVGGCSIACGWQGYLARPADIAHPYATPATAVRLAGMAPLLVVSIADHPLQDEGRRYVERLRGAGVRADELALPDDPRRAGWPEAAERRVRDFLAASAPATEPTVAGVGR